MKRAFWCALLMMAEAGSIAAQAIKVPEGWDKLAAKASSVVNVNMDKKSLGLASRFMDDTDDAQARRLASRLNGIYVRILEFKNPGEFSEVADVEPIRGQLQGPEWTQLVDINDKETKERVEVYLRQANGQTIGMVVLAEEPKDLTFVHLDGPIDVNDLSALEGNFGIPATLGDIKHANAPATTKAGQAGRTGK